MHCLCIEGSWSDMEKNQSFRCRGCTHYSLAWLRTKTGSLSDVVSSVGPSVRLVSLHREGHLINENHVLTSGGFSGDCSLQFLKGGLIFES